jgi:hypothetical protein
MKITKKIITIALLIGVVINLTIYSVTLHNNRGCCEVRFRSRIEQPFFISVGGIGINSYTAGSPFESKFSFYHHTEGCPCSGVSKLYVLFGMVPTWQFIADLVVWSSFPAVYLWLRNKK